MNNSTRDDTLEDGYFKAYYIYTCIRKSVRYDTCKYVIYGFFLFLINKCKLQKIGTKYISHDNCLILV